MLESASSSYKICTDLWKLDFMLGFFLQVQIVMQVKNTSHVELKRIQDHVITRLQTLQKQTVYVGLDVTVSRGSSWTETIVQNQNGVAVCIMISIIQ